jgi:GNAT superfamily N-acetyltransferase
MRNPSLSRRVLLRSFEATDLPALIRFWNHEFRHMRNFHPLGEAEFQQRILDAPATDPAGLILAWHETAAGQAQLVGLVHAFRPPPQVGLYRNWTPNHYIALLYVAPDHRRRGIGSRLLQAAESWLYYCPVHFASHAQPVYGAVEGPRPPLFGSTERLGLSATSGLLIDFLAKRGYISVDAGDVSMQRMATVPLLKPALPPAVADMGLQPITFSHQDPFQGREATQLPTVSLWHQNDGDPYWGVGLVDTENLLRGHLAWYPMPIEDPTPTDGKVALINFRVDPDYRHRGAGSFLLDWGLYEMTRKEAPSRKAAHTVELHTHLTRNADAVRLYRSRGFEVVDAWVNLVKT